MATPPNPDATDDPPPIDKWAAKYLRLARAVADDNEACYSRRIGCVLVSAGNRVIGQGYNGSVAGAPHCDSAEHLKFLWDRLLTEDDREALSREHHVATRDEFVTDFAGCRQCPRRLLGCASGQRLEICGCAHAERNAITSAASEGVATRGASLYCWCPLPCFDCASAIVQAGIRRVVCLAGAVPDYSPSSRQMFEWAQVEVVEVEQGSLEAHWSRRSAQGDSGGNR